MERLTLSDNGQWDLTKSEGEFIKQCSCGTKITTGNAKYIGHQDTPDGFPKTFKLYNCPKCETTVTQAVDKPRP